MSLAFCSSIAKLCKSLMRQTASYIIVDRERRQSRSEAAMSLPLMDSTWWIFSPFWQVSFACSQVVWYEKEACIVSVSLWFFIYHSGAWSPGVDQQHGPLCRSVSVRRHPTAWLSPFGLHNLSIRARDDNLIWSVASYTNRPDWCVCF